jgi:hypothetical protein
VFVIRSNGKPRLSRFFKAQGGRAGRGGLPLGNGESKRHNNNMDDYQKVVSALKRKPKGATAADVCAATALPLARAGELLPKAADEYSGHLRVTQSGEILYHFPNGFTSRRRGLFAGIKKAAGFCASALKTALVFLFKVWITVMLVGYFVLFMALALASVFLTVAAQSRSSNNRGRGSFGLSGNLFSLIWRIWFYSELTKPRYGRHGYGKVSPDKKKGRPLHKAVFSFVFGEEDPNAGWEEREDKDVIAYIQSNRGVLSIMEYMALTGKNKTQAEEAILSFCARFSGSPEVTQEGVIVYRFDSLMLGASSSAGAELRPQVKRLKTFSYNSKNMNVWFTIINAVNLILGSYFLYNSLTVSSVETGVYQAPASFYLFTNNLMEWFVNNPPFFIFIALGIVPFVFSLFFWIIPAVRKFVENRENEDIKLGNFKKFGFNKIWNSPLNVDLKDYTPAANECMPKDIAGAKDRVIKDAGSVSIPEVEIDENGNTLYSFKGLEDEKNSVRKYRESVDIDRLKLGNTVFDSNE